MCNICSQDVMMKYWSYQCPDCNYVAHVDCGIMLKERTCCDDGCFIVHESCGNLPYKLRHILHPRHPLLLHERVPYLNGVFRCIACANLCNGFAYICGKCTFTLDVGCGTLKNPFEHEAHEHLLTFGAETTSQECKACGHDCVGYFTLGCKNCDYSLHIDCALAPKVIWNDCHRHPFTLTYFPIQEDDDENVQDDNKPDKAIYLMSHDDNGDISLKDKMVMKLKQDSHHHFLTLIYVAVSNSNKKKESICFLCKLSLSGPSYHCQTCQFYLHKLCAEAPKSLCCPNLEHTSTLTQLDWPNNIFRCKLCRRFGENLGFICDSCKYKVHVHCAIDISSKESESKSELELLDCDSE
ncbi:hypothetical protein ACH5RR_007466 [Cinchona calisaya]|uniref:Phorbol-ester/DAG-type domain-containing protein n=1 Tax=Cinchona calisaya TaxID=153742 RepID=A0ABD3AS04_9GENT